MQVLTGSLSEHSQLEGRCLSEPRSPTPSSAPRESSGALVNFGEDARMWCLPTELLMAGTASCEAGPQDGCGPGGTLVAPALHPCSGGAPSAPAARSPLPPRCPQSASSQYPLPLQLAGRSLGVPSPAPPSASFPSGACQHLASVKVYRQAQSPPDPSVPGGAHNHQHPPTNSTAAMHPPNKQPNKHVRSCPLG